MHSVINFILNTLLSSIPEETFTICVCLVLLGLANEIKFDYRIIVSILNPAVISNTLRYFFNVDSPINFIIFIFSMTLTLIIMYKQFTFKRVFLVFVCTVTACLCNMILEILNYSILILGVPINDVILKENAIYAFVFSLPFRLIELIIMALYIKHRKEIDYRVRINLTQQIIRNKEQRYFALIVSIINIFWIIGSVKIFIIDKILINFNLSFSTKLFLLVGDILTPILIFGTLMYSIYCSRARDIYLKASKRDLFTSKVNIAKYYASNQNYKKVETILDEVAEDILTGGDTC